MRISAEAAECTERIVAMTRPVRRIKGDVSCWSKNRGRRSVIGAPDLARPRALVAYQVTAPEHLLERERAAPVAREPEATALVVESHADRVTRAGLTSVCHVDLECGVAVDRDRYRRVG